ncbi:hypothetical protein FIBSPDRAFT_1049810 [Athelia psychrophila]|uniref:F-box domain-containing protein n=1 Tax=Athelia psychrophila TaxID=1759441 RepID=A0A166BQY6_9AGAM|nr:hypothetical protein FIBSPDRAFT_1049810 [Fibularhizoctonia sp. CBS 109695]
MRSLPVEVLEIIVQTTSTEDQLELCISCKLLNELAVRSLYKVIDLAKSPAKAVRCCKTLVSNKSAALAVRSIRIANGAPGSHYLRGYNHLVERVLKFLPRLVELFLKISTSLFTTVIDHCVLPNLLRFVVISPFTASVVAFIRRHPKIQVLRYSGPAFNAHDLGDIDLPALNVYHGPANIIPNILAVSPVRKLVVVWNIDGPHVNEEARGDYDRIFASLVFASVEHLDVMTQGWNLKLLSAISKYFPLLRAIDLRKATALVASGGVTIDNLYDSLRDALPAFQHLRSINLTHIHERSSPVSSSDLDKEFEIVMGWGDICPSVDTCTLPSGVTWLRVPHAWLPRMEDSDHDFLIKWHCMNMASGKYPALWKCAMEMFQDTALWLANPELLAQFLQLDLTSLQAIANTESESVVGSDGDSGEEEASENDTDPDEDSDGEEGNQDDADQDSDHMTDGAESEGDSDGEEEVSVGED